MSIVINNKTIDIINAISLIVHSLSRGIIQIIAINIPKDSINDNKTGKFVIVFQSL